MPFDSFHFLRPMWLVALLPLAYLVWAWFKRTQADSGWQAAIDEHLIEILLEDNSRTNNRWLRNLLLLGMLAATLGLAGPTWEKLPQNVEQKSDALVILLDLSLSMLAEDVQPSRIERARQKVTDILRLRDEGLTALVAYAGDAHAVVPLTDDTATIENLLGALGPEMMPVPGSNPDHALELARQLFDNSLLLQGRIIMITDGIDSINSVTRHRDPAYPISVIGIGTEQGGEIPLDRLRQPGKVLLTQEGNRVIALLDHVRLGEVAGLSFGKYAPAVIGDGDIIHALSTRLPGEDETLEVEREFDTWFDQGHWFAVLLLPLFLWLFRRGVMICIPALPLLLAASLLISPAPDAQAADATPSASSDDSSAPAGSNAYAVSSTLSDYWDALWLNNNQRGAKALRYGQPEKAATLFSDPMWQAAAQYRSANYPAALSQYSEDSSATGQYNQANSLARMGQYQPAIDLYNQVLAAQPEHEDAAFNKALLERLLEEQQQAQQQQNQDQQQQASNEQSDDQQQQQPDDQQQSEQQESDNAEDQQQADQQQQDQQQQGEDQQQARNEEDEATRDEKQEALEQWLRRVPDDPGGLLRRKFTHETKQRLRRGEYENRQSEKIW